MREGRCYGLFTSLNALVAQLAEHIHGKDEVNGSIPFEGFLSIRFMDQGCKTGTASPNPFEGFLSIRFMDQDCKTGALRAIRSRA